MRPVSLIGVASGIGAMEQGCGDGPIFLKQNQFFNSNNLDGITVDWHKILLPIDSHENIISIHDICNLLAESVYQLVKENKFFTVIGGDHSCAIGTWSGVFAAVNATIGPVGLLWIDAHLDSHTFQSSPSGNIHGMPLAALLGHGSPILTSLMSPKPKLLPNNTCIVGARSFEKEEQQLLNDLGVRIFYMDEINRRGLISVMKEAIAIITQNTKVYGISIDIDAIDPVDAPGVGTPAPNGILAIDLLPAIQIVQKDPRLLGIEIAEYNPYHDKEYKTAKLLEKILLNIVGTCIENTTI